MRISDWSSDVCSSDLRPRHQRGGRRAGLLRPHHQVRDAMRTLTIITALAAGGLLAACTPQEELHPTFGNAVHHNMSLHIINPAPTYSTLEQVPDFDGPRAAGAQQRYDDGEVIPPERLRTSDTGGSN